MDVTSVQVPVIVCIKRYGFRGFLVLCECGKKILSVFVPLTVPSLLSGVAVLVLGIICDVCPVMSIWHHFILVVVALNEPHLCCVAVCVI